MGRKIEVNEACSGDTMRGDALQLSYNGKTAGNASACTRTHAHTDMDRQSETCNFNETVSIQLAQCWFPQLAISNAKI